MSEGERTQISVEMRRVFEKDSTELIVRITIIKYLKIEKEIEELWYRREVHESTWRKEREPLEKISQSAAASPASSWGAFCDTSRLILSLY